MPRASAPSVNGITLSQKLISRGDGIELSWLEFVQKQSCKMNGYIHRGGGGPTKFRQGDGKWKKTLKR
jgi:hypothetical protein